MGLAAGAGDLDPILCHLLIECAKLFYYRDHNIDMTLVCTTLVLGRAPDDEMALRLSVYSYGRLERADDLLAHADRLLAIRPDDVQMRFNRANALLMLGRADEARDIIDELAQSDPNYLPSRRSRAVDMLRREAWNGALS